MNESSTPNVVVLGDTRDLHHHGCEAVLAGLTGGLAAAGIPADEVISGLDWKTSAASCLRARLLVINGEGSLHHDRPAIRQVLEIAECRKTAGLPTALVNSSWFEISATLTARLAAFDLVALRESRSFDEVAAAGIPCIRTPDLAIREAMARRPTTPPPAAGRIITSDSTDEETTLLLRRLAGRNGWVYLPVLYPPAHPRPGAKSRKIWRKCQLARLLGPLARVVLSPRYHAHLAGAPDLDAYCLALSQSAGVVTGRFHTVCLCIGLGVPFVAVASNTPKIESLLADAGLDASNRMAKTTSLLDMSSVPHYTDKERAALSDFASHTTAAHDQLFTRLRTLMFPHHPHCT